MENNLSSNKNFDILLNNFNFLGGLTALVALGVGLKVGIKLDQKPDLAFHPELSLFYPRTASNTLSSMNNYRFMLKCSKLFPNHFFPQRVLTFNKNLDTSPKFNVLYDSAMGYGREEATFPILTSKFEQYSVLADSFPKGNLAFEYRFDRNMATFDLLRMCALNGAQIYTAIEAVHPKITFNCKLVNDQQFSVFLPSCKWPLRNPARIDRTGFSLTFQAVGDQTLVHYLPFIDVIRIDWLKHEIEPVFQGLGIHKTKPFWDAFDTYISLNNNEITSGMLLNDEGLSTLKNALSNTFKQIKSVTRTSLGLSDITKLACFEPMSNDHFRQIQAECDIKYDIAKQTGITYAHFVRLFYRYRQNIDAFTDVAYEMLETSRDAQAIWQKVEKDFLDKEYYGLFDHNLNL